VRNPPALVVLLPLSLVALAIPASAETTSDLVVGSVIDQRSAWTGDASAIVTRSTVSTDQGPVEIVQLGGTADGIGMIVSHGAGIPKVGTTISARVSRDAAGNDYRVREIRLGDARRTSITDLPPLEFSNTTNETGAGLYWSSGCVFLALDADGTNHIPGDDEFDIMTEQVAHWRQSTSACSYMDMIISGRTDAGVGFDYKNVIKFQHDVWARDGMDYADEAGGLTTLFYVSDAESSRNGEILDADIEINAIHFAVSTLGITAGEQSCLSDLSNTFTHEFGHLLALDHTCWAGVGPRPVDQNGTPVPRCTTQPPLPTSITESTMYPTQECGETKKATLEQDDIAGICNIYPDTADPLSCGEVSEPGGGCCSTSSGGQSPWFAFLAVGLFALSTRRRRR
jgi:MYXO-CTERM domain-containing protein